MISLCAVAPAQTVTEFPIPNGFGARGITAGPDGNLWFTEYTKVGRVTPSGVITLYDTPTFSFHNNGIATGPDGNLWFTEQVGIIGRITPTGAITEFPLPGTFLAPSPGAIAAGPDGNIWFTEFLNSTVGRITPSGVMTEFPFPSWRNPYGIAAGPDGNLWLTEQTSSDLIGRFTLPQQPPPPAASFYTLTLCRVIDTRNPVGPYGGPALSSEGTRVFALAGQCGIPSGATAVAVNLAVTQPTNGPGFLTLYPAGEPRPLASSINFRAGQTRANNAILALSGSGALSVYCFQGVGTTHLILDVTGYFQ